MTKEDLIRTELLKAYLELRTKSDAINEKLERAKKEFTDSLGDVTEIHLAGLKVVYKYNTAINAEAVKTHDSAAWVDCLKDPEMDIPLFRKRHPELVEKYTIDTKTRPLKIIV
jgi:hypothetical protein